MVKTKSSQLGAVLRKVVAARQLAASALRLPDADDPGGAYDLGVARGPASSHDIMYLEKTVGASLPPSVRAFLAIRDGFADVDLGVTILTARKIGELNKDGAPLTKQVLAKLKRKSADGLVVFGVTSRGKPRFIFDTKRSNSEEWAVINYDSIEGLLDEHASLIDFLDDLAETITLMASVVSAPPPMAVTPKKAPRKNALPKKAAEGARVKQKK